MRSFLDIVDLSAAECAEVLDLSEHSSLPRLLDGLGAALVFEKPSARTRNASEMAIVQLGGHPVTMRGDEVGFDQRESAEDIARTLSCYHALIAARVFSHTTLERMAQVARVPVVNLLSDRAHPMQALADLLTIRQEFGTIDGVHLAYVGDSNNVCRSLTVGAVLAGAHVRVASPAGYGLDDETIERVRGGTGTLTLVRRPAEAVEGADVVYTDTWVSMGQEAERDTRIRNFEGFTVDAVLMGGASPRAIFLHCLPAKRGYEVTDEVVDATYSRVWRQAANRMHSARGLFAFLFGAKASS